jgi:3-hydroxyacyl-[acyl-carrier-protein] dehydratase
MSDIDRLPHRPPMRLIDAIVELESGVRCVARRRTRRDDFFFQGHFPERPIVPAVMLVEMLAQAGGLAAAPAGDAADGPVELRVAAFGTCKFPAAAGPDQDLEIDARLVGRLGGLYKIQGQVRADGVVVATGELTLADPPPRQ